MKITVMCAAIKSKYHINIHTRYTTQQHMHMTQSYMTT